MEDSGPKLISLLDVSIAVVNQEFNQLIVAMVRGKMKGSELFVSWCVCPFGESLLLLVELHTLQVMLHSVVVELHKASLYIY
jgi:hypothetical protein